MNRAGQKGENIDHEEHWWNPKLGVGKFSKQSAFVFK
jgi:hypothetical protein